MGHPEEQRQHDVFVSYSDKNQQFADEVVERLEHSGIRCWYAKRDMSSGVGYAGKLTRAIREAKVLLLLFSEASNISWHVLNEVDIAFKAKRVLLPLRLDSTQMSDDMEYYLTRANWLDAIGQPLEAVFPVLRQKVAEKLDSGETPRTPPAPQPQKPRGTLSKEKLHQWANPSSVRTLEFLNTIENAPPAAEDLSEEGDGSVLGWRRGSTLFIAGEGGVYAPEDCSYLFSDKIASRRWDRLRTVRGGAYFDTAQVKNMSGMFYHCTSLTTLDVSKWDTCEVTTMRGMFLQCHSLTALDVSNWDTSMVENLSEMFAACHSLTALDVGNWDTSMVEDLSGMFSDCHSLTELDVSGWDTSYVRDLYRMFGECSNLTTLDVSNWDTSRVKDKEDMFYRTIWERNPPI